MSLVIEWAQIHQEALMEDWNYAANEKKLHKILLFDNEGNMTFKRARIVACKPLPHYRVWIRFDDESEGEVDLNHLVGRGVFEAWKSVEFF